MPRAVDQLEEISIDRLAEKQPLERRRTQRLDQLATGLGDTLPQGGKVSDRMEERDMPAELGFVMRHHEAFDKEHMKLLAMPDVKPSRINR